MKRSVAILGALILASLIGAQQADPASTTASRVKLRTDLAQAYGKTMMAYARWQAEWWQALEQASPTALRRIRAKYDDFYGTVRPLSAFETSIVNAWGKADLDDEKGYLEAVSGAVRSVRTVAREMFDNQSDTILALEEGPGSKRIALNAMLAAGDESKRLSEGLSQLKKAINEPKWMNASLAFDLILAPVAWCIGFVGSFHAIPDVDLPASPLILYGRKASVLQKGDRIVAISKYDSDDFTAVKSWEDIRRYIVTTVLKDGSTRFQIKFERDGNTIVAVQPKL